MFESLREAVAWLFRVSPYPPHVPAGQHGQAHVFRASLAYWEYQLFFLAVRLCFLGAIALGAGAAVTWLFASWRLATAGIVLAALILLAFAGFALVSYVVTRLDYEFRWYVVTDRSLRIRQGIATFEETTLTFANVQNVEILQGPVERWFGFANVLVETAGGGGGATGAPDGLARGAQGHRGLVRGLDDAATVRDLIRGAVIRQGGAGLGDRDDRGAASPAAGLALAVPRLREVLDEVRLLRTTLEQTPRS